MIGGSSTACSLALAGEQQVVRLHDGVKRFLVIAPDATLLKDALPEFAAELVRTLRAEGRTDLGEQIATLRVVDRCRCGDWFCATFYTVPKPDGPWGKGHETVPLELSESRDDQH